VNSCLHDFPTRLMQRDETEIDFEKAPYPDEEMREKRRLIRALLAPNE